MVSIETRGHINFTDEGVTTTFNEGDNVICCVDDEERHVGKITAIGSWKENEDAEPYQVVCIDTSKNARSYSSEIIKVDDITYICKNPLADNIEPPMNKEDQDKKTFVSMLVGLGCDKNMVENVYDKMVFFIKLYSIPISQAIACTIHAIQNNCNITVSLKDMCGIDVSEKTLETMMNTLLKSAEESSNMAVKAFEEIIESYKEGVDNGEEVPSFSEILELVSANWCHLTENGRKRIAEIIAGVDRTSVK